MSQRSLSELIDQFSDEWMRTVEIVQKAAAAKDFSSLSHLLPMKELKPHGLVSKHGHQLLIYAANQMLTEMHLDLRVTAQTAKSAIATAFSAHLDKARKTGVINDRAVIAGAKARLKSFASTDGTYALPARIGSSAKKSDFRIGPIRVVSKPVFLREYAKNLRKAWPESPDSHQFLLERWIAHLKNYDQLILVEMAGFEEEMGWRMARECAEFALNLIRMVFRYQRTSRLRLAGDFSPTMESSSAVISSDGFVSFSTSWASRDSTLDDRWQDAFDGSLGPFAMTLASYAAALASGTHSGNPTTERLRHAHMLIAEAYCEPSDFLRLVRLISALEALALVERDDKVHQLATRCACAGGWSNPATANRIFDRIRAAYHWRNAIVHGDAPPQSDVARAFANLEEYLLEIVIGFMVLFARIAAQARPQSVRSLRRELKDRIDAFFWAPELFA